MMYVEFMKNFLLGDLSEQMAVTLISASWKIFLLANSSELMAVRLILASWVQKQVILLCRHDVRRVHEKFSSRRFERADGC